MTFTFKLDLDRVEVKYIGQRSFSSHVVLQTHTDIGLPAVPGPLPWLVIMVALWNRADHYIFILSFVLLSIFFSSPNLSRRILDVCHTSTHGVALVQI